MAEYKLVDTLISKFEKAAQSLVNDGFRPSSGIVLYEKSVYNEYTYRNDQVQYLMQTFIKG